MPVQLGNMCRFAETLADRFSLASLSVLVRDTNRANPRIKILFEPDDARETNHRYIDRSMYDHDPFMNNLVDFESVGDCDSFLFVNGDNLPDGCFPHQYRSFMIEEDIKSFGAFVRGIAKGVDIIVGIHGKSGACVDRRQSASLAQEIARLQDIACLDLLRGMLREEHSQSLFFLDAETPQDRITLSARETDVMALVRQGRRNKEIAHLLSITENTVEGYLKRMFRKMNVSNRAALISRVEGLG